MSESIGKRYAAISAGPGPRTVGKPRAVTGNGDDSMCRHGLVIYCFLMYMLENYMIRTIVRCEKTAYWQFCDFEAAR
jgi:hypothetical protein